MSGDDAEVDVNSSVIGGNDVERRRERSLCRVEGDALDGRADAAPLDSRVHVRGRWLSRTERPFAVRLLGEDLVAFRDSLGQARRGRRALPAPARVACARAQRGMRPALSVPRLEDRRRRQRGRQAVGARPRRSRAETGQAKGVSQPRGRRLRLGMDGPARRDARIRAAGVGAIAGDPDQHRQDARRMQLGAGARGRDRFRAQLEPARDRTWCRRRSTGQARPRANGCGRRPTERRGCRSSARISAFATWRSGIRSGTPTPTIICASRFSWHRSPC